VKGCGSREDFEAASGTIEERLRGALAKLSLAAREDYRKQAKDEGLSALQAQTLSLLAREGPIEMGELSMRLGLTPPTVSDSVAALERRGLVRREPLFHDRRRVRAIATPRGKKIGRTFATWPEVFEEGIAGLSREEKEVFFRILVRMILSLLAKGVIEDARMCATCAYFRAHVHGDVDRPHHCALVDVPLGPASLRLDCPDHEKGRSPAEALFQIERARGAP
jgi:DNA-binding MarR family transcriptional regulator